jgi:hypothetical protein
MVVNIETFTQSPAAPSTGGEEKGHIPVLIRHRAAGMTAAQYDEISPPIVPRGADRLDALDSHLADVRSACQAAIP